MPHHTSKHTAKHTTLSFIYNVCACPLNLCICHFTNTARHDLHDLRTNFTCWYSRTMITYKNSNSKHIIHTWHIKANQIVWPIRLPTNFMPPPQIGCTCKKYQKPLANCGCSCFIAPWVYDRITHKFMQYSKAASFVWHRNTLMIQVLLN